MFCNLCGRDYPRLNKAEVEGAIVDACDKCARFGIKILEPEYKVTTVSFSKMDVVEFAENYGEMIKRYRESHDMTREEFAKRLSEKISVIKRLEDETISPDVKLMKKVEGMIGMKLADNYRAKKPVSLRIK
jgi:putative transcription factor